MTKRKLDMLRVAKALGLPAVAGETTSALADRCEERAAELLALVDDCVTLPEDDDAQGADELAELGDDAGDEDEEKEAPRASTRPKARAGESRGRGSRRPERRGSRAEARA